MCRLVVAGAALMLAVAGGAARAGDAPAVPVMVGGEAGLDACASTGIVAGLRGPRSFLAIRRGPGLQFEMAGRLRQGARLWICEARGGWLGVVHGAEGLDCGVSSPRPARQAYRGPCVSGWVAERFVRREAG